MRTEQAHHLLGAIRAQASTEFGSIQQHQLTLARAQDEEDQAWVLRMMAEELRHGYQMLHLLVEDDWSVGQPAVEAADMVEEILSMQHRLARARRLQHRLRLVRRQHRLLRADRPGRQVPARHAEGLAPTRRWRESMPQMLREEAFHLATGVVPMRRWVEAAAQGRASTSRMAVIQKALNKWIPRGLEMFGDERGGATNVKFGLKPMKNAEAQQQYYDEVEKVVHDLNLRYLRAKLPELAHREAEELVRKAEEENVVVRGIAPEELLRMPHKDFFRRRGVPAFRKVGFDGVAVESLDEHVRQLIAHLPESYISGRDFKGYLDTLRKLEAGEWTLEQAVSHMPALRRVGGVCPCSKSVRWVIDEPAAGVTVNGG